MSETAAYNAWLHRYAMLTAFCTFLLVIAGGLVTSTGSGLAVPDWPLSYGMFFPPLVGGILYEHGHRMIAGAVGKRDELVRESADLIYHLLVLWAETGIVPDDVWAELARREGTSGIAEKAGRDDG